MKYVLALDQGTTSSRAIVFGHDGRIVAQAQEEFEQILPAPGIVEHDPESIWGTQLGVARRAMAAAQAFGRPNRRPRRDQPTRNDYPLAPPHRPPGGQRRGLAEPHQCGHLRSFESRGVRAHVSRKTGLVLDPYFSGTKIKHLLDTHDGFAPMPKKATSSSAPSIVGSSGVSAAGGCT